MTIAWRLIDWIRSDSQKLISIDREVSILFIDKDYFILNRKRRDHDIMLSVILFHQIKLFT